MEYIIEGGTILLDEADAWLLENHKFKMDGYGYALTHIELEDGSKFPMRIHQMVLGHVPRSSGICVDHKNRNPRDNRLENLRYVSRRVNLENSNYWDGRKKVSLNQQLMDCC